MTRSLGSWRGLSGLRQVKMSINLKVTGFPSPEQPFKALAVQEVKGSNLLRTKIIF